MTARKCSSFAPAAFAVVTLTPWVAVAQQAPGDEGSGDAEGGQAPTVVQAPPTTTITGLPNYPGPVNPDAHLPSGSQSTNDTSRSRDGFDLLPKAGSGSTVRGSEDGTYIDSGSYVPETYTVRRGDTLWDLSSRYYQNPYNWPRLWAMNEQIQNPHWIYPGDRLRMRGRGAGDAGMASRLNAGRGSMPSGTVFLRDFGWVDDPKADTWGEIVGSPDDQMLLSNGDAVYVQLTKNRSVTVGQELTVFRPLKTGGGGKLGEVVSIRGTVRVDRINTRTNMMRARIIEAVDVIERGARIGPLERKFDVVRPVAADRDLEVHLLGSVYPHKFYGQHQVVFLDKGEKDGLKPGHRLFAIRRGDPWRGSIDGAGNLAATRPRVEDDRDAQVDPREGDIDEEKLPDETYAELRVLRVRKRTATAIVVESTKEIERDPRIVMKRGY